MNQELCISCDSHVVEGPDIFVGLEERFGELAPRIVHIPDKGDVLQVYGPGSRQVEVGRFGIAGHWRNSPEALEMIRAGYKSLRPGIVDPIERLKDQDLDGVTAEVLLPSVLFGIYSVPNAEVVAATFKNYNDWISNYCSHAPNRLFPTACIPLHDVDLAIEELQRAKTMGHVGADIPCTPPVDRPYSDHYYDKFWAAAEEMEMPLIMHFLTGAQPNHGLPNWGPILNYCLAAVSQELVIGDLICNGVVARYPGLKFVVTEWETGWVAHFLQRLDWSLHRVPEAAAPEVTEFPSHYFHKNFLVTFEDDRIGIATRDEIGVRNMMWGSDYPHHDSIFPHSQDVLDDIFDGVSAEDRYRITVANCCELYKLPFEY
jgi:predicted TIM-barrel fold metal-dependent hydrolase